MIVFCKAALQSIQPWFKCLIVPLVGCTLSHLWGSKSFSCILDKTRIKCQKQMTVTQRGQFCSFSTVWSLCNWLQLELFMLMWKPKPGYLWWLFILIKPVNNKILQSVMETNTSCSPTECDSKRVAYSTKLLMFRSTGRPAHFA